MYFRIRKITEMSENPNLGHTSIITNSLKIESLFTSN